MEQQRALNLVQFDDERLMLESISVSLHGQRFPKNSFRNRCNWNVIYQETPELAPVVDGQELESVESVIGFVRAMERQRRNSAEIIEKLAAAVSRRDEETGGHISRIGNYAGMIASGLGLPEKFSEMVAQAATLHDIGKIAIPDAILSKPGSLTRREFEAMKNHTVIGGEILSGSSSPVLRMAASIAETHHERWDGSGYPRGLSGEQIPLAGRIVMLADQYDALRSRRVYKPALDHATSCAILSQGDASTRPEHFDPAILNSFLSLESHFQKACAAQTHQEQPGKREIHPQLPSWKSTAPPASGRILTGHC